MPLSQISIGDSSKREVLKILGKEVDEEGYLVEIENPEQRVLTPEGEEVLLNEWGGLRKGSEAYVKSDFVSMIDVAKRAR